MNWMIFAFHSFGMLWVRYLSCYSREIGVPFLNIPVTPISRELVYILAYKGFKNKSPRNTNTPKHPPLNPPFF